MDARRLRYFLAVAEELHFGRAADKLHLSQPPLSMQIRALEKGLGTALFHRAHRRVELTEAGRILLDKGHRILIQLDAARALVQQAGRGETGELAIGFITPIQYTALPTIVRQFRRDYPHVKLQLRELMSDAQIPELLDGSLGAGFLTAPLREQRLARRRVMRERMIAAIPAGHPLARAPARISIRRLAGEPAVMFPRAIAPVLFDEIVSFCKHSGFSLRIEQEAAQTQTIVSLVSAGLGVAIVPESIQRLRRPGVVYRKFSEPSPIMETVVAWLKDRRSEVLQNFLKVVGDAAAQLP
jgi:DNA-binding transcriptional LysR family regulator